MEHGFNLTLTESDFRQLVEETNDFSKSQPESWDPIVECVIENAFEKKPFQSDGKCLFETAQSRIRENFETHILPNSWDMISDGVMNLSKIGGDWFPIPKDKPHVFLSHSHDDLDLTLQFAGWLKKRFNLDAFIDASVWRKADDLLKMMDDKYCSWDEGRYSYSSRNRSTAYVHMLLYSALMTMIDITPCFIFLNTSNSTDPEYSDSEKVLTASPWIYGELFAANLIACQRNEALRKSVITEGGNVLPFRCEATLKNLRELDCDDLKAWAETVRVGNPDDALKELYKIRKD